MNAILCKSLNLRIKMSLPQLIIIVLLTASFPVGVASNTVESRPNWILGVADAYTQKNLSSHKRQFLEEFRPRSVTLGRHTVTWSMGRVYELHAGQLTVFAVSYWATPDIDIESVGTLVIVKDGKVLHQESNSRVSPLLGANPLPALAHVRNGSNELILFSTYQDITKSTLLRSINMDGKIVSSLATEAKGRVSISDTDGDRLLELSGYGLHLENGNANPSEGQIRIFEKLSRELGVKSIYPMLDPPRGPSGLYRIFALSEDGRILSASDAASTRLYQEESQRILKRVVEVAEKASMQDLVNAVALYMGILEGIGEQREIRAMYDKLPANLRSSVDPRVIAQYWAHKGHSRLMTVFPNKE